MLLSLELNTKFVSLHNISKAKTSMSKDLENAKCQDILNAAKTLFWKHGIKRVSIQEICTAANASKMTFYRFFDNKVDLVKTLLDIVFDQSLKEYEDIMAMDIPFAEKVQKTLIAKSKNSQDVSQELVMDMYKNGETDLLAYITERSNSMMNRILDDYEKAQKEGDIRPEIKREFILYVLHKMIEMMLDEKLIALYKTPQELTMELTNFFFYGLLTQKD
jgi:AcrR family transcriptional regulator